MSGLKLGILGGGQLARMTALAAADYGVTCSVFDPDPRSCAGQICSLHRGSFDDLDALRTWAKDLDAVTLEFENVPAKTLEFLAQYVPVRPNAALLENTQDRWVEKNWLKQNGFQVAPYFSVDSVADLLTASKEIGGDMFLKTRRMGYDGKGQIRLAENSDEDVFKNAVEQLNAPCIVEAGVPFVREVSMIVARNPKGQTVYLPMVENQHEALEGGGKILRTTIAPAPKMQGGQDIARKAGRIALEIADAASLEGLLAIEIFQTADNALWINELAPRPHNSGHWSMDGANLSQFHLLVRAALDFPLPAEIPYRPCVMTNLLGDEVFRREKFLAMPNHFVHIYGKDEARPGRKMGHINKISA